MDALGFRRGLAGGLRPGGSWHWWRWFLVTAPFAPTSLACFGLGASFRLFGWLCGGRRFVLAARLATLPVDRGRPWPLPTLLATVAFAGSAHLARRLERFLRRRFRFGLGIWLGLVRGRRGRGRSP